MRRTDLLLNILAILKRIYHPYYTEQGRSNGTSNSIFLYGFTNTVFFTFYSDYHWCLTIPGEHRYTASLKPHADVTASILL